MAALLAAAPDTSESDLRPKTIILSLLMLVLLPAAASASSRQVALFQDDPLLVHQGAATRAATLDELQALGVDAIKVQLHWSSVAPAGRRKPSGFDGRDPAEYPGFTPYDAFVADAQAQGFRVMIALSPPAPGWATARRGDREGADRPSAREFARFVEAIGRRYPTVDLWTLWNEPNHPGYLYPQATSRRVLNSPRLYRGLMRATTAGLKRSGHSGDRVLFGELLPIGKSRIFRKNTVKPILWLRELFCLDSRWRPYRGRTARLHGCNGYRKLTGFNGFAYHPYTRPQGPRAVEPSRDDATIRSIGRITRALDIARRKRRIGGPRMSVWNTEFDFQSNPPDRFGARLARIPSFMSESEWMAYRNPRVASHSQYTMRDAGLGPGGDTSTWQGGLKFVSGKVKRGVYAAYRLPLFVRLLGPNAVEVWGAARPGGAGEIVQIQERRGPSPYRSLGNPITVKSIRGYFRARFRLNRAARREFRFTTGDHTSWTVRAANR